MTRGRPAPPSTACSHWRTRTRCPSRSPWCRPGSTAPVAAQIRAAPAGVRVLQHGYAHQNHEPPAPDGTRGRPAELGRARPVAVALAELGARVGPPDRARADPPPPALVPPWNRIAPAVTEALARRRLPDPLDLRAARAGRAGCGAPGAQYPRRPDPVASRQTLRGAAWTLDQITTHLADRRRGRVDVTEPTGLLTHHRDLTPAAWACLDEVLGRLGSHPAVAFPALDPLLGGEGHSDRT